MPELIMVILGDIRKGWLELQPTSFALPVFISIWAAILLTPLTGTDRKDIITALVYSLFCSMAGMMLIFVLPRQFSPEPSMRNMMGVMAAIMTIGFIRYFVRRPTLAVSRSKSNGPSKTAKAKQ